MAIYTRHGSKVEILNYCGKHQPKGFSAPIVLVRVLFPEEKTIRDEGYVYARNLVADGAIQEIDAAVDASPEMVLDAEMLKLAMQEAA